MTPDGDRPGGQVSELKRRAYELGLEVGEENHLESVGWVNSKLQEIREEASRVGIFEEVRDAYQKGKKMGVARRSGQTLPQQPGFVRERRALSEPRTAGTIPKGPQMPKPTGFIERIPPEVGLKATLNIMTFVAGRPDVKRDLNGLLAGILDLQERINELANGDTQMDTFQNCLQLIAELGWVERYHVDSFDDGASYISVRLNTAIGETLGPSDEPVCQPVCTLLETIGRKALGRSVKAVETECVAQGKHACSFEVTTREAASDHLTKDSSPLF